MSGETGATRASRHGRPALPADESSHAGRLQREPGADRPLTRRELRERAAARPGPSAPQPAGATRDPGATTEPGAVTPSPWSRHAAPPLGTGPGRPTPSTRQVAGASPSAPRRPAPGRTPVPAPTAEDTQTLRQRPRRAPQGDSPRTEQAPGAGRIDRAGGADRAGAAAAAPSVPPRQATPAATPPAVPLTRAERRALAARAAEAAVAQPTPSPVTSSGPAVGAPAEPTELPQVTRRSRRDRAAASGVVPIVPPPQTGAIRAVDDTGRLTPVRPISDEDRAPCLPGTGAPSTGRTGVVRPDAPTPAPTRGSGPGDAGGPGTPTPAQPSAVVRSAPRPSYVIPDFAPDSLVDEDTDHPAPRSPSVGIATPPPVRLRPPVRGEINDGLSGAVRPIGNDHDSASPVPGAFPTMPPMQGRRTMPLPAPPTPVADPDVDPDTDEAAQESAVGASPTSALPSAVREPAPALLSAPTPAAGTAPVSAVHDDLELDEDDEPKSLRLLHYLVLVAIAVVLGLVIWKFGFENAGASQKALGGLGTAGARWGSGGTT